MRADACQQFFDLERLADIVDAAGIEGHDLAVDIGQGGHKDDRDVAALGHGLEAAAGFETVDVRHHDVEQDQVGFNEGHAIERFLATQGDEHFEAALFKMIDQHAEIDRVVIDDQDFGRRGGGHSVRNHAASPCCAYCSIRRRTAGD